MSLPAFLSLFVVVPAIAIAAAIVAEVKHRRFKGRVAAELAIEGGKQ